jgi:hypothetical protein
LASIGLEWGIYAAEDLPRKADLSEQNSITFGTRIPIAVDNLVDDLNVLGSFGVFRFSLQFPFSLMIELLIPALRLTGFLPKFVGAADNFHSGGLFHCGLFYF